jgi:hypothetical protein
LAPSSTQSLKLKATILFFFVLVYIGEWAALPFYINPEPPEVSCCAKTKEAANTPCQKPPKDCNTTTCCVNCPLCYVMTVPGVSMPGQWNDIIKKEFSLYLSHYDFTFFATSWKPPNVG